MQPTSCTSGSYLDTEADYDVLRIWAPGGDGRSETTTFMEVSGSPADGGLPKPLTITSAQAPSLRVTFTSDIMFQVCVGGGGGRQGTRGGGGEPCC